MPNEATRYESVRSLLQGGYSRATDLEPVKVVFSVRIRESQANLGQMNGLGVSRQVDRGRR